MTLTPYLHMQQCFQYLSLFSWRIYMNEFGLCLSYYRRMCSRCLPHSLTGATKESYKWVKTLWHATSMMKYTYFPRGLTVSLTFRCCSPTLLFVCTIKLTLCNLVTSVSHVTTLEIYQRRSVTKSIGDWDPFVRSVWMN